MSVWNLRRKEYRLLAGILVLSIIALSCGSPKQKAAIEDALRSLRKISSATEVGVNYAKYGEVVIEANTSVNESLRIIRDKETAYRIMTIMGYYKDALTIWGKEIKWNFGHLTAEFGDGEMIAKYNMPLESDYHGKRAIEFSKALQIVWARASSELAEMSK